MGRNDSGPSDRSQSPQMTIFGAFRCLVRSAALHGALAGSHAVLRTRASRVVGRSFVDSRPCVEGTPMSEVILIAETGRATGTSASKRLRAEGKIPAVLYGQGVESTTIQVDRR